jgi:prephenate dehydrogenase
VILATPPSATVDILKSLDFLFNSSVTITDTTSAKSSLNKILQKFNFPENIIFSHPVAGSHLSGEENSIDDLFKGKSTILSYHDSAAPLHVNRVMSLWQELGSKVSVLDAELHDRIFAYSSHLPHVVAYALLNTLKEIEQDDLALFSGGGLGEFLRLVSSSPEMWADIFSTNGKNIALAINDLVKNLNILQNKIANDPESLQDLLSELKAFKESNY